MTYPLTRTVYIFFAHRPGDELAPRTQEFLRYVLSAQGQADVAREGAYMPLPTPVVKRQLRLPESGDSGIRPRPQSKSS